MGHPRPTVATRSPRNFAISDLMILVAGSALGCSWTRANWMSSGKRLALPTWADWRDTWQTSTQLPTPLLFSLGIAALACRFTPPRPPLPEISRQPGVIALAVLSSILSINASIVFAGVTFEFFTNGSPGDVIAKAPFLLPDASELFIYQVIAAGPSVILCWVLQRFIGWWEPERFWMDRMGRFLGGCLIAIQIFWFLEWISRPR